MSIKYNGPVVLVVMDGVGLSKKRVGNPVYEARAETFKHLLRDYPKLSLGASGHYVGIPDGDMGNSEVGHNAMGAGQIILQGPAKVQNAFESGEIFETNTWQDAIANIKNNSSALHFIGIFSDGNTHSNIDQVYAMMKEAQKEGVKKIRLHASLDGRDTPPESAEKYIKEFEDFVHSIGDPDYRIASGGGRMVVWSDRYENDWGMVERGWQAAMGEGRQFANATDAVLTLRTEAKLTSDQYIPPFVIAENGKPVGTINKGDSIIYFDFRADRAIEAAIAFTYHDFPHFSRKYPDGSEFSPDDIYFAGMSEYNNDTHVPAHTLVPPVKITHSLTELLDTANIIQYTISETVKYGHITYYFDGNNWVNPHDTLHEYIEVPSETDTSQIITRPWMKSAEITDAALEAIKSGKYQFIRINFPNGDMVGHFGQLESAIVAIESVDLQLGRLIEAIDAADGMCIVTADHGNVEEISDAEGSSKTSHTTNPVPCIFYDNTTNRDKYAVKEGDFGLANLAPAIALLLGQTPDPTWLPSVIEEK